MRASWYWLLSLVALGLIAAFMLPTTAACET